jgi:hypothetical protein
MREIRCEVMRKDAGAHVSTLEGAEVASNRGAATGDFQFRPRGPAEAKSRASPTGRRLKRPVYLLQTTRWAEDFAQNDCFAQT